MKTNKLRLHFGEFVFRQILGGCGRSVSTPLLFTRTRMGSSGLEPPTSRLSGARSNQLSYEPIQELPFSLSLPLSGDEGIRTPDPLLAGQVLSQLSYTPRYFSKTFKIEQCYP